MILGSQFSRMWKHHVWVLDTKLRDSHSVCGYNFIHFDVFVQIRKFKKRNPKTSEQILQSRESGFSLYLREVCFWVDISLAFDCNLNPRFRLTTFEWDEINGRDRLGCCVWREVLLRTGCKVLSNPARLATTETGYLELLLKRNSERCGAQPGTVTA